MQVVSYRTISSKFLAIIFCACVFMAGLTTPTQAQVETVAAAQSNLTGVTLPTGALRVQAQSVPPEINQTLEKLVAVGAGKLRRGDREVLAWSGAGYKKAQAASLLAQLQNNLQATGWTYEIGANDSGVTIFSVVKDKPSRRTVLGFFVPTDDALVVAWTEVLLAGSQPNPAATNAKPTEQTTAPTAGKANALLGTWTSGGMSMMADRNRVTGATTPSNGSTFKYVFTPDGRFEFIGLIQSTLYGCTTTLFNDKRGSVEISGSTLMLVPNKNFWRQQNSCAPNSNKEKDHTLAHEAFQFRTKTDEYGKAYLCLTSEKGETCYRRAEK